MADTDYSALLEDHLKAKFGISIDQVERSWFKLPSGAIIYVNGSKLLVTQGDSYGWYDLGFKEYEKLVINPNCYYVIILDKLELTFILPHTKVKEIFSEVTPGNDNEWHYKLRKKNGHYILRPSNDHRDIGNVHYVEDFLNRWTQLEGFKNNLLSFTDLQKFLLEEMQMQANYQPIMIRTLLQSEGKATKEDIVAKIKELNPGKQNTDFNNIPVYDVLEKNGIVRKQSNGEFVLNSVELSGDQRQQLIALCNWKIVDMPLPLEDLISAFDKDRDFFGPHISEENAMKSRSLFVSNFAPNTILDMNIDDYVFGKIDPNTGHTDQGTFCYQLEFRTDGFGGIRGTPANKFGIYCDKETQNYLYNKDKHDSPESAFKAVRAEIHSILEAGKQISVDKDWSKFAHMLEGEFDIQRHVRSKILSVYYPNEVLQMHSNKDGEHILKSLFGLSKEQIDKGLFLKQAKLLELKNAHPVMKKWSNFDFSTFIWRAVGHKETDEARRLDEKSVWLVRAGGKGEGEQIALEKNVIGIGYGGFERSDSIKDIESFRQHFIALHPTDKIGRVNRVVPQIWNFLYNMKRGDFVVLPLLAENSRLVAVRRIEGGYQDNELHSELTVIRPVKWLKKDVPKSEFDADLVKSIGYRGTVYYLGGSIMVDKLKRMLKKMGVSEIGMEEEEVDALEDNSKIQQMKKRIPLTIDYLAKTTYLPIETLREIEALLIEKRQIIFYGPPGTGKTYVARMFSEYFSQNIDNVETIQFHQSYSYEDFVEGIKPTISKAGGVEFSRQPGLFKNLVKKCIENPEKI